MAKVFKTETCWLWIGANNGKYGHIRPGGSAPQVYAHRISHELYKGPIPEGLEIDHICRNTLCVNPEHLRAVTRLENHLASPYTLASIKKKLLENTHCGKCGSLLKEVNWESRTKRYCRPCNIQDSKNRRNANPEAHREESKAYYWEHRDEINKRRRAKRAQQKG